MTVDPIAEEIANDHFLAALLNSQARRLISHDRAALRRELLALLVQLG